LPAPSLSFLCIFAKESWLFPRKVDDPLPSSNFFHLAVRCPFCGPLPAAALFQGSPIVMGFPSDLPLLKDGFLPAYRRFFFPLSCYNLSISADCHPRANSLESPLSAIVIYPLVKGQHCSLCRERLFPPSNILPFEFLSVQSESSPLFQ